MPAFPDPAPPHPAAPTTSAGLGRLPAAGPTTLPAPIREPALRDPARPPAPLERRLPAHRGKLGRIGDELTGLGEDLKEWVELRIELARTEIEEQIAYRVGQAKQGVAAGLFAVLGALFALVTLAIGLGWLLGHAFWGFLIVTLLLFAAAGVLYARLRPTPPPSIRPDRTA